MEILKRKCWICKDEKELNKEFFNKDSTDSYGFQKSCKGCQKKRSAEYRKKNKEYFDRKNKEHYNKEDNKKRYEKYKDNFLKRKAVHDTSLRGKMYNLLEAARTRAKNKKLDIDIDLEFLLDLYEKQEGKCALTNIKFTFERNPIGVKNLLPYNPSIDKINPSKGYTKDNVRLLLVIMNLSLNNFGEECLYEVCKAFISQKEGKVLNPPSC